MFKHELGDHPLGLRKQPCLKRIEVAIRSMSSKVLTVIKMYLPDDV